LDVRGWVDGGVGERKSRGVWVRGELRAVWLRADAPVAVLAATAVRVHPLPSYLQGLSGAVGIVGVLADDRGLVPVWSADAGEPGGQ
jgi:hypothetical protein